ncbi:MAG: 2-succinyl-5-enolpyruvyl-6-hydroxy-3-cyclohexene-1-carboxylic-acid synthase [Ignavibacteria bacterium]|jgi:2-succinyl-5-enolpyruvyl-6-hydroxy-3-cyclohexene-1-carboxylate synthase
MESLNRNIFWCRHFVKLLSRLGVKYACISPGYRNTSLTAAFAENSTIKKFVHVDERSNGFFSLGLAKQSMSPVAIVATSGTAVAELYPAIIEAYLQRIPLIICTADRPAYLRNTGANQTINQENIFANHIRYFFDFGLPEIDTLKIKKYSLELVKAFNIALNENPGPIHLNFPFNKPFEPSKITDEIDEEIIDEINSIDIPKSIEQTDFEIEKNIFEKIKSVNKGIIFCGISSYSREIIDSITTLSQSTGFPIFADGLSQLRYGKHNKSNVISNYITLLKSDNFKDKFHPELIIHFGSTPTSQTYLDFYENSNAYKIAVNEFGDLKDPSRTVDKIIKSSEIGFCKAFTEKFGEATDKNKDWVNQLFHLDKQVYRTKVKIIDNGHFSFEPRIISETIKNIPNNSNLFISNSTPVRDIDNFASLNNKYIKIFSSRGASGIDGIISTTAGIAAGSKKQTFLIIGDLAFFHDMNGMLALKNFKIPLKIILINNFGGGIFEGLPIEKETDIFSQYFKTPLYIDFRNFVKGYGGNFVDVTDWHTFNQSIKYSQGNSFSVFHFKTNSKKSHQIRNRFWNQTANKINEQLNESSD